MADKPATRNDASLNTGMSSAVERRGRQRLEEQQRKRADQRAQITPGAEVIVKWIDAERELVIEDLAKLPVSLETSEKNVKAHLVAVKMHLEFLTRLKMKTKTVMRDSKAAQKAADKANQEGMPDAWKEAANAPEPQS